MTDEAMPDLARILPTQKTGQEEFYDGERSLGFSLLEFWQWAGSNLLSNRDRGILAEFLVGRALGVTDKLRTEWDAMDYLLTWNCKHIANAQIQRKLSEISLELDTSCRFFVRPMSFSEVDRVPE